MKPLGAALSQLVFVIGAIGLLGAMCVDFAAVVGRHIGVPLLGSIELSQLCIVCMASASLLGTTLERGHARVQLLTERLPSRASTALERLSNALSALFFAFLLIGSCVLVAELWNGDEVSELLHLPIAPLRVLWCAVAAGIVATFLARALARRKASSRT